MVLVKVNFIIAYTSQILGCLYFHIFRCCFFVFGHLLENEGHLLLLLEWGRSGFLLFHMRKMCLVLYNEESSKRYAKHIDLNMGCFSQLHLRSGAYNTGVLAMAVSLLPAAVCRSPAWLPAPGIPAGFMESHQNLL